MKKICVFLISLILCVCFQNTSAKCYAKAERTIYAKALNECVLYKTTNLSYDVDNVFFVVPETYFVTVLDELENSYKVQYDKFVGYVKKDSIVVATFTPILKTLTGVTCDVKTSSGTQIWNKPSTDGGVLTTISAGTENINYIASVYGTIPSGGETNLWFYVSYTPMFNSTNVYEGYVYSENLTNLSEIVSNVESNPEIVSEENDDAFLISSSFKTIVIALITIPIILLFVVILYKFTKFLRKKTNYDNFQNNEQCDDEKSFINFQKNKPLTNEMLKLKSNSLILKITVINI